MTRKRERGQVLVIFAGGLIAFLAVAALVFDVGQNLLDWRAQRNAADAAALAGARYITEDACEAAPSAAVPGPCANAVQAALLVAARNGYGDLDGDGVADRGTVTVYIPPQPGNRFAGEPGFLEVDIHTDRPSFFAAVLGVLRQNVDALAVAGNSDDIALGYSIIATDPGCDPVHPLWVHGGAQVTVGGDIQVNSNCEGGLTVQGQGSLNAPECNVVGTAEEVGNPAQLNCTVNSPANYFSPPVFDPPANSGSPDDVEVLAGRIYDVNGDGIGSPNGTDDLGPPIPPGCPGSANPATAANPIGCSFPGPRTLIDPVTGDPILDNQGNPVPLPPQDGYDIYRIYPGTYWGGLHFSSSAPTGGTQVVNGKTVPIAYSRKVRVYFYPGVYHIAGGGFDVTASGVQIVSMDRTNVGADPYPTKGRGVLIYNDEDALYSAECAAGAGAPAGACIGDFHTRGGSDSWSTGSTCATAYVSTGAPPPAPLDTTTKCSWVYLAADDEGDYAGLVYYQNPALWARMIVNGASPKAEILGTIYVPYGEVQVNGNSDDAIAAQIIAWHIDFSGTAGFSVTYDPDYFIKLSAAGLVQ